VGDIPGEGTAEGPSAHGAPRVGAVTEPSATPVPDDDGGTRTEAVVPVPEGDADPSRRRPMAPPPPSRVIGEPLPPPRAVVPAPRPPRPGELTPGWRFAVGAVWVAVAVALGAVWNTSVQLGLSTWWLGPRGDPQPVVVRVLPFVAPLLMVMAVINRGRWLGWFGLLAAAATAAIGIGDLGRVSGLAVVELVIAAAGAAVSIAAFAGTYHRGRVSPGSPAPPPSDPAPADSVDADPATADDASMA
jgi:hypothetical protein